MNQIEITYPPGIPISEKGAANGVCPLDALGKIVNSYLPSAEEYYFAREEIINNNSATIKEYFTEPKNGTEIPNTATFTGGDYHLDVNFIGSNTSTSGSVRVNIQVGGVSVFSVPYEVEPKDNDNVYYNSYKKDISIPAGLKAIDFNLTNVGSGTRRIFEANIRLTKKIP